MTADLITAYIGILTAASTGVWAVKKYTDQRKERLSAETLQSHDLLAQRKSEENLARQERVANLIKAVGDAGPDASAKRWTMSALSLYPDESLDLLLEALGQTEAPEDATAIKIAVISIGPAALERTVHAHRIAGQICAAREPADPTESQAGQRKVDLRSAQLVHSCTREIIVHLLYQMDDQQRSEADLAHVDLSEVNFSEARLPHANLRKASLDRAFFARANLKGAKLRGAKVEGTVFTHCNLRHADLTGAKGKIRSIRADMSKSILDRADLSESTLDAARLTEASLHGTTLRGASLPGAVLTGVFLNRTSLTGAAATKLSASRLSALRIDASHADISKSSLDCSSFEHSKLVRLTAVQVYGPGAALSDCNLNGAEITHSRLMGAHLSGCTLGGTRFHDTNLENVSFSSCVLASTDFSGSNLDNVQFTSCTFKGRINFRGVDLSTVHFSRCSFDGGPAFEVDNSSWQSAKVDDETQRALREVLSNRTPLKLQRIHQGARVH